MPKTKANKAHKLRKRLRAIRQNKQSKLAKLANPKPHEAVQPPKPNATIKRQPTVKTTTTLAKKRKQNRQQRPGSRKTWSLSVDARLSYRY